MEQITPIMPKIAAAFVKAQKAFGPALKSSTNPHFRSKYADLSACVEAVIDALNANGIGLMQRTYECSDGVMVETVFIHESGEVIEGGILHVPAPKSDPQGYGSALTYARRYSLLAATGLAPEDDDGNAASGTDAKKLAELIQAIESAKTEDELKKAYFDAIKAVGNDQEASKKLIAAKDKMKGKV